MKPSTKSLEQVFGDRAKEARRILEMTRDELLAHSPAAAKRDRESYHPHQTYTLRLDALDAICDGSYGVLAFQLERGPYRGQWLEYLNTGDTYATTLVYLGGYRIGCWGDYAEKWA